MIYFLVYSGSVLSCSMVLYVHHSTYILSGSLIVLQIHDADSTLLVAQLLFLEAEDTTKPIHLYINSPGGSVTAGLAIYDTVSLSYFPV